jgi:hypothetical protein
MYPFFLEQKGEIYGVLMREEGHKGIINTTGWDILL